MMRRIVFSFFLIAAVSFGATAALAQTLSLASDVSVTLTPEHPGPNTSVTIQLTSFSTSLENAYIAWTVDGRAASSGVGADRLTLSTKTVGVATSVAATISPVGETPILKTIRISPASVDILWQATDAVVPPFYRGRSLPTKESAVKFVAIPEVLATNGSLLAPGNFVYAWKENYVPNTKGGYGKNGYASVMDYLNPAKHIGVELSSRDGSIVAVNSLDLVPNDPKILWYASSPLYGPLYDHALDGSYSVTGSDTSLIAEPYFFSPKDPASKALSYEWKLNGNTIDTPFIPNSLFLHRESADTGTASVSVSITNLAKLFQDATARLTLSLE
jgi:hypothetical protein